MAGWFYPPIFSPLSRLWRSISVGLVVSLSLGSGQFFILPRPWCVRDQEPMPSWTVLCGRGSSLAFCRNQEIAYLALWLVWFDLSSFTPSFIWWESPYPVICWGHVLLRPFSLLLAALVRVVEQAFLPGSYWSWCWPQGFFYFFVLTRLREWSKKFSSPFSALTFPTVITATSLNGTRLVAITFLDSSCMDGNSSLSWF